MQISNSNYTNRQNKRTNFKAVPVANIRVRENINQFIIYEAAKEDLPALKRMCKKLKMPELMPDEAGEAGFHRWKEIIDEAVQQFKDGSRLFIATYKKRPCGVLSFTTSNSLAFINEIASFPVGVNNKIKYTGTSLMKSLFEEANNNNYSKIMLIPSTLIHKNPTGFYKKFHFKELVYSDVKTNLLFAKKEDFSLASREIDEKLQYIPEENKKQIPLDNIFNPDFLPHKSFKEKITDFLKA